MKFVTVANTDIQIIEYQGERVLTTDQMAQTYECEPVHIQQNYANNKDRFEEGKHFYKLTGQALKDFKASITDSKFSSQFKHAAAVMLWTRRGASRHCKMLGTDKAWEMFDALEENYFNPIQRMPKDSYMIADPVERAKRWIEEETVRQDQAKQIEAQKPMVLFANSVSASKSEILVGELAKIIKQNGVDMGEKRLFTWLRGHGYLINRKGTDWNMPTQYSMERGLFRIKETTVNHSDGHTTVNKTPKVTGKGQIYFVNKFLGKQKAKALPQ